MRLPILRRLLRPAFICLAAAMTLGLTYCQIHGNQIPVFWLRSVSPELGLPNTRGLELTLTCYIPPSPDPNSPQVKFDTESLLLAFRDKDGDVPTDVKPDGPATSIESEHIPDDFTGIARFKLSISADAQPRVVQLCLTTMLTEFGIGIGTSIPFQIGFPPVIRAAQAVDGTLGAILQRGIPARVEFLGERFDETAEVFPEDPDDTISDVAYSAATQSVFATITTPVNGRTGLSRYFIKTAGGESNYVEIGVRADMVGGGGGGTPGILSAAFPSSIKAGTTTVVALTGTGLTGNVVVLDPPVPGVALSTTVIDDNTLHVTFDVGAAVTGEAMLYTESGGTRASYALPLPIAPPGAPLPRITSITPATVTGGVFSGVQVRIVGENLGPAGAGSRFEFLPNPTVGEPYAVFQTFQPIDPTARNGSVVYSLIVYASSNDPSAPIIPGRVEVGLQLFGTNLTTNVVELMIEAPPSPADGRPFVSQGFTGAIRRSDGPREEFILGERLTDVTAIVFDQPGVTATLNGEEPDGTLLTVTVDAADDAVLTGDAATNFHVITGHGRSNDAGAVISP